MCNETTSASDSSNATNAEQQAGAGQQSRGAFAGIGAFWNALQERIAAGDIEGALRVQQDALDFALEPYYIGGGELDHVRFLTDLQTAKGAPLDQSELEMFGRAAGRWCARQLIAELEALPIPERMAKALEYALNRSLPEGVTATVEALDDNAPRTRAAFEEPAFG